MTPDFDQFFSTATGNPQPYAYQRRLAEEPCISRLISVPTGLGKTAAVVLAWLWNRQNKVASASAESEPPPWPRRLVYCLPMRTLVEQTRDEAKKWLKDLLWDGKEPHTGKVGLHILMGGEDTEAWDLHPEQDAILIGTQDMLLSRALNRGYGMSRYRWPMHFGLLNNDCLWVMDETQLMGVGVETSAQLDGFRQLWQRTTACPTWWMSATLEDNRLATVDHPAPANGWPRLTLSDDEKTSAAVSKLINAKKPVEQASYELSASSKGNHASELAALILREHKQGTLTLVVVNRVPRARELFMALTAPRKQGRQTLPPLFPTESVALIHSRFRREDRASHETLLFASGGDRIVIATQAVEAGVDVSARLLITELAPWSSLVQRFGRCNRRGDIDDARVLWINIEPKDAKDDVCLPYTHDELQKARAVIATLADAGPQSLTSIRVAEQQVIRPIIRRRDLIDLFDTTPDLCGQDLDISRYIRDGEDSDVQFFWRSIADKTSPTAQEPAPARDELCRVPRHEARKFIEKNKGRVWAWNALNKQWVNADHARAGAVYLVATDSGGYDDGLGWTGDAKHQPTPRPTTTEASEAYDDDSLARHGYALSYADHVRNVVRHTDALAAALIRDAALVSAFHTAALWHDAGKAHPVFQTMLSGDPAGLAGVLQAKSADKSRRLRAERRGFRHELASALAWLVSQPDADHRDLIAYLIAAHHGKVRLSIRSLPDEKGDATTPDRLFARGIWDQDLLPAIPGLTSDKTPLHLSLMQMGEGLQGPSWLARMIALRDQLGPFHLAYLETLIRAADMRASAEEAQNANPPLP
jgi:CRISPR-associated endonuclease/helicase Cas3